MISIERIYDYISLPPEQQTTVIEKDTLPNWPQKGKIVFENVSLSYGKSEPYILTNVNITIEDQDKIGVIGRTGAGKSTLIFLLFRLVELPKNCGRIFIDEEDIADLGLKKLRTSLSVIPQDPVLFMGTIRMNLDPFNEFSDDELWNVLEAVN